MQGYHNARVAREQAVLAENTTEHVRDRFKKICGPSEPFDVAKFATRAADYFSRQSPPRRLKARTVAFHEAGHFISSEIEGFGAGMAEISGSPFGRDGWCGVARALSPYCSDGLFQNPNADIFIRDARNTIAGPIAEELFGDGRAIDNVAELFESRILVARAVQLSGRKMPEVWNETLSDAVARVEFHSHEIRAVADVLERRKHITRAHGEIARVLDIVARNPFKSQPVSERGKMAVSSINKMLKEFLR